jgi:hypothetical protein
MTYPMMCSGFWERCECYWRRECCRCLGPTQIGTNPVRQSTTLHNTPQHAVSARYVIGRTTQRQAPLSPVPNTLNLVALLPMPEHGPTQIMFVDKD